MTMPMLFTPLELRGVTLKNRVVVAPSGDLGVSIGHIRFNQPAEDGSERAPIPFFTESSGITRWLRAISRSCFDVNGPNSVPIN